MFLPTLPSGVAMRLLSMADAEGLAKAYRDNREHLAPWEPARDAAFFTEAGQAEQITGKLVGVAAGTDVAWVLMCADGGHPRQGRLHAHRHGAVLPAHCGDMAGPPAVSAHPALARSPRPY